jgi:hypothetical protein
MSRSSTISSLLVNILGASILLSLICLNSVEGLGGAAWAAPGGFFGPVSNSNTAVFGSAGYTMRYSVTTTGNAGTLICCDAKAFVNDRTETWRSIGCGHETFSGTLPWGNVVATPAIKCKGNPFGASVSWSH